MLDYTKLFVQEFKEETLPKSELVLYMVKDSSITVLNSSNEDVEKLLQDAFSNNQDEIIDKNSFIFVLVNSDEKIDIKHRIWCAMAKIYDKILKMNRQIVIDGKYSTECIYSLIIKSYSYDFLKKESNSPSKLQLKIKLVKPEDLKILTVANLQNFARFLGDTPANLMTPSIMAEYLKSLFSNESVDFQILDKKMIESEKMNLVLSVSQGSSENPVFVHAKYYGRDSSNIDVALVGKGVTFDTGGISLKSADGMFKLKQDMMGAAICASLMKIVSSLGMKINLSLALPLVENMPGSSATKPGDVFISKSGKSVEVDNTDAEGRLILADAITFAQKDNPEYLFDIATLTGAVRIALGNVYGSYFTDSEELSCLIAESSKKTGDLLWRLPLSSLIASTLPSQVADLCNNSKSKSLGASATYAAEFIKAFVNPNVKWSHFDVSGIRNNHHFSELFGDQTTGRPLLTLFALIEELEKKQL